MPPHLDCSDYSRYFSLNQRVYLVNMSGQRNSDIYESLSGVVTKSGVDCLEVLLTHGGHGAHDAGAEKVTYKLTCEALGSGIQVLADLVGIVAGNIFQFRMHGSLEMFQRRSVPRVELSVPLFQLRGAYSLEAFRKEWNRVMERLRVNDGLPGLDLKEAAVNLSVGGIGFTVEASKRPTPLSIFFIALDEGIPVCAVAETVWERREDDGFRCGFRFIHILKTDQERINRCVSDVIRRDGGTHLDYKRNWVLVDKMVAELRKPE